MHRPTDRDQRSTEAADYRRLYRTSGWLTRRARQLAAEPLCRTCASHGRVTAATVADHIIPHRGDATLFFKGALQSLCDEEPYRCHSRVKQREEHLGFSPAVDASGFPIDHRHPANQD
jgi:hypothetical protein